VYTTWY
jgi:hypothetical protein